MDKVCGDKVCVDKVCGEEEEAAEEAEEPGIQNQKQEPHTKMWGKIQEKQRRITPKTYHLTCWIFW